MNIILQHDERDCGAACMSMIASHFGLQLPLSKFREMTSTTRYGCSIADIVSAADNIKLDATVLNGSPKELELGIKNGEITLPLIAHIIREDGNPHFIVVQSITSENYNIVDPGYGKRKLPISVFTNVWTGYLIVFKKQDGFQKGNQETGRLSAFVGLFAKHIKKTIMIAVLTAILSAIGILAAFSFQLIVDGYIDKNQQIEVFTPEIDESESERESDTHDDHEEHSDEGGSIVDQLLYSTINYLDSKSTMYNMWIIIAAVIILYFIQALIQYFRGLLIIQVSKQIDYDYFELYYKKIVSLPLQKLSSRQTGEYMSRFSDLGNIRSAISNAIITIAVDSIMAVGCCFILFRMNPILGLLALLFTAIYVVIVLFFRKPIEHATRNLLEKEAMVQSYLKEVIDGAETIKVTSSEQKVANTGMEKFQQFLNASVFSGKLSVFQGSITEIMESLGVILIIGFGCILVNSSVMTLGQLVSFYSLFRYFTTPVKNLVALQPTIQNAYISADRINDILDMRSENNENKAPLKRPIEKIEFRNLCFSYDNAELKTDHLSYTINKGERIAVVGTSGCGKTTLAKLLLGLYQPQEGKILINQQPLNNYSPSEIRRSIAYISQNAFFFSDTIRNNLICDNMKITDIEILNICEKIGLRDWLDKLPMGLSTPLSENGSNLSSGQKQRLAVARAIIQSPDVLILDEATSNLDTKSEEDINRLIFDGAFCGICIYITHRVSNARKCDRIVVLQNGKIVEEGTHGQLKKIDGIYSSMN